MIQLSLAALVFLGLHVGVSATGLRGRLVARWGEGRYMALFSLASGLSLVWLILAFAGARGHVGDVELWGAQGWRRHAALALGLLGFLLAVPGLLTSNPTAVKGEGALDAAEPARGIVRVTRHPFLWGVALWALGHVIANGDAASLLLFGVMLALGVAGPASIDRKRRRALGPRYARFEAATSSLPFAAILQGRQRLSLREIGAGRLAAALGLFAGMLALHPLAFHANPLARG